MNTKIYKEKGGRKAQILGVYVNSSNEGQVLNQVSGFIEDFRRGKGGKRLVFTPNPEMLVEAYDDPGFRKVLNSADINIADGVGLQLASRVLALKKMIKPDQIITSRLTGTDLTGKLVELASQRGYGVFFLGGSKGVAQAAKSRLLATVTGTHKDFELVVDEGPQLGLEPEDWRHQSEEVVKKINKFKPDLLFVAFGHKRQETWLVDNKEELKFGVGLGVGGAFDFISGRVRRAPRFIQSIGFEWLYRLTIEPWRLRRQLRLVRFVKLVLSER